VANFDFVTDESLREALESDARELDHCLKAGAHKAVHVLSGSIVEAVLADHLIAIGYEDPKGSDVLELDLGQLVTAAKSTKALSARTADLASVVRSYRNLIHPGRVVRLKERVSADTAAIANHLVEVVAEEVAAQKRSAYGLTAQQIVAKLELDPSAMTIFADLLKDTPERELERLLTESIPTRYLELAASDYLDDETVLTRLKRAYRLAVESAPNLIRKRVAARYVRVLKEEPELEVTTYESVFFQATDLSFMAEEDALVAKRHLLAHLEKGVTAELAGSLVGIGEVADADDVVLVVDACVRHVIGRDDPGRRDFAESVMNRLWREMPIGPDAAVPDRLSEWERTFEARNNDSLREWTAAVRSPMEAMDVDDIPF